jgi:DNA-directed RNA polymerase specialized sigma24 family protein
VAGLLRKASAPVCGGLTAGLPAPEETSLNALLHDELLAWLVLAMANLKPADRFLLIRHHVDGRRFVDIGKEMHRNSKALARRDKRLLDELQKLGKNH